MGKGLKLRKPDLKSRKEEDGWMDDNEKKDMPLVSNIGPCYPTWDARPGKAAARGRGAHRLGRAGTGWRVNSTESRNGDSAGRRSGGASSS